MTNNTPSKTASQISSGSGWVGWLRGSALTPVAIAALVGVVSGVSIVSFAGASAETASVLKVKQAGASNTSGAYLAARFAQNANDVSAASRYIAKALDRDPGNVALLSRSFTLAVSGGDMDRALELGPRLREVAPDHQMSALLMALEVARDGDFENALKTLQTIEPFGIAQVILPLVEAWMHQALGNREDAIAALDPMLALSGFGSLAMLHHGLILDQAGDLDGALAALNEARELGSALRLVQALGSVHERLGDVEQARALYQAFAEENPDSLMVEPALARIASGGTAPKLVETPRDGMAEALFHIATAINQEGGSELGLMLARMSLHMRPDFPVAELLLAEAMVRGERYQEALDVFDAIDPDAPASWSARLSASSALDQLDRQPEAIDLLRELAEQRDDRSAPLVRMGDLLRGESRFDEAIEAYDEAMSRAPELGEVDWTFLYKRGIALERAKQWERAERDLIKAIDINPNYAHLLNYLGYSWIDRGENLAEGEELIREAVKQEPNDGFIVDSLGWAFYRTGRMEEAVEALERAVSLRPEDPVINDHLGDAYWMVGRRKEARFQWVRARRTADDDALLLVIEDKLANGLSSADLVDGPRTAGQPTGSTSN